MSTSYHRVRSHSCWNCGGDQVWDRYDERWKCAQCGRPDDPDTPDLQNLAPVGEWWKHVNDGVSRQEVVFSITVGRYPRELPIRIEYLQYRVGKQWKAVPIDIQSLDPNQPIYWGAQEYLTRVQYRIRDTFQEVVGIPLWELWDYVKLAREYGA